MHQCFRKVRVGKKCDSQEIKELLAEKSKLKMSLKKTQNEEGKNAINIKINDIEKLLETLSSERNIKIIQEHIKLLGNSGDRLNQNGMWKLKNQLWPKERDPPMAKFDEKGNLISGTEALKSLYLRHYVKRLAHRGMKECYAENYKKKVALWKLRFSSLRSTKSAIWGIKELRDTIKSLKNNKTRDPSGLLVEIF